MRDSDPFHATDMQLMMTPMRLYFKPEFIGLDSLNLDKPALFVGNHTRYGALDVPLMIEHLNVRHGVMLRSLGDSFHFHIPLWREYLIKGGVVEGTPQNCDLLMQSGASILVFPGGGREVMRRKHEQYTLIWKRRLGFVRQAIKHGYDIIPFGSLGADDCYHIIADADDVQRIPHWNLWTQRIGLNKRLRGGDIIPPLGVGLGATPIPRPERFYFGFGARIATDHLQGMEHDEEVLWAVRAHVAQSIELQLASLKQLREKDRTENWSWLRRALTAS